MSVIDLSTVNSIIFGGTEIAGVSYDGIETSYESSNGPVYLIKDGVVNNELLQGTKFTVFGEDNNFVFPTGNVSRSLYTAITCSWGEWNDATENYVIAQAMHTPNTFMVPSNASTFVIKGYATNVKCLDSGSRFYLSTNLRSSNYKVTLNQNGSFECKINVEALRGQNVYWIVMCYRQSDSDTSYGLSFNNVYFE